MKLQQEIENLNQMVIKMADMVEENLKISFDLLSEYSDKKACLINDDIVDLHERLVEEMSMSIMLKERPYASDMRMVLGILKLVEDIERLGDHAEDIRDFSKKISQTDPCKIEKLDQAVNFALKMVHNSMHSFISKDLELSQRTMHDDDIIDALYEEMISELISKLDQKIISSSCAIYYTLVIKYIERIADHASNIAEWVIYILLGYHKDKQIF